MPYDAAHLGLGPPVPGPWLASTLRTTRLPITHANGATNRPHHRHRDDAEDEDQGRLRVTGASKTGAGPPYGLGG